MINLLPKEDIRQLRAAKSNVLLRRYIVLSIVPALAILSCFILAFVFINAEKSNAERSIQETNQQLSNYQDTQKSALAFQSNINQAKSIFNKESRYSKALLRINQIVPDGIKINGLQLSPETIGKETTISAVVGSENEARKLRQAFTEAKDVVSSVKFGELTMAGQDRFILELKVTFKKELVSW